MGGAPCRDQAAPCRARDVPLACNAPSPGTSEKARRAPLRTAANAAIQVAVACGRNVKHELHTRIPTRLTTPHSHGRYAVRKAPRRALGRLAREPRSVARRVR